MRILIASSLVLTLAATSIFLACSSDDATTDGGTTTADGGKTSSTSSSGTSGTTSGDGAAVGINADNEDPTAIDGGCRVAPASVTCILHCTGYQSPTTVVSTPRTDAPGGSGDTWTDPDSAETQDSNFATVTLNEGEESASLDATGYGFNIPSTDSTYGIAIEFAREADGVILDAHFTLLVDHPEVNGQPAIPVDHLDESVWPTTQDGVHHYGQCLDTWELDLNPVDVNSPTFGARVSVKRGPDAGTGPITAKIDSMRANVCYCTAAGN